MQGAVQVRRGGRARPARAGQCGCAVCAHTHAHRRHMLAHRTRACSLAVLSYTLLTCSATHRSHTHMSSHTTYTHNSRTHIYGGSHAHTRSGPTSDGDGGRIRKTLTRGRNARRHRDRDKEVADRLTPSEGNTAMGSKEVAHVTTESAQGRWHPSPALCRSHWNRSGPSCSGPPL